MFRLRYLSFLLLAILTVAVGACADKAAPVPTAPSAVAASGAASLSPSSMGSGQMVGGLFTMTGHSDAAFTITDTCVPGSEYFPMGCHFEGHGEGVASHFGRVVTADTGTFPNGGGTIVAANGDLVTFVSNNFTGTMTITGGTGRFTGASGSLTGLFTPAGAPLIEGGFVKTSVTWRFEGTITY